MTLILNKKVKPVLESLMNEITSLPVHGLLRNQIIIGSYDDNKKDDIVRPISDCGYVLRNEKRDGMG